MIRSSRAKIVLAALCVDVDVGGIFEIAREWALQSGPGKPLNRNSTSKYRLINHPA